MVLFCLFCRSRFILYLYLRNCRFCLPFCQGLLSSMSVKMGSNAYGDIIHIIYITLSFCIGGKVLKTYGVSKNVDN